MSTVTGPLAVGETRTSIATPEPSGLFRLEKDSEVDVIVRDSRSRSNRPAVSPRTETTA